MTEWGLRARVAASDYFVVLVAAAIVVLLAGGWLVYTTHINPAEEQQTIVQSSWESTAGYTHQATVSEPNQVFPVGTTLEDRSTYYTRLAPELNSTFTYRFDATDGQLDVTSESQLIIQTVNDNGDVMWRVSESLGNDSATLAPDEQLTVGFNINVSEVRATIDDIESDLGASLGETEVFVRTDVTAAGTAAGASAEHTPTYDLALTPGADTYSVSEDGGTEQHNRETTVSRDVTYGPLRSASGPLLVLFGLSCLVALGIGRYQGYLTVDDEERAAWAVAKERDEFDEWISQGSVQKAAASRQSIEIQSLEDLVDVAVDTNSRVIEDVDDGNYYVIVDDTCYMYRPPNAVPATDT